METIFLACFIFGALFTVASVVLGTAHVGHIHFGSGHAGHGHVGGGHVGHADAGAGHGHAHASDSGRSLPLLNVSSLVGAVTWFGAAGYFLTRAGDLALPAVLLGALIAGGIGWYLIARFLGLLLAGERQMDPEHYR